MPIALLRRHFPALVRFGISGGSGAVIDFGGLYILQFLLHIPAQYAIVLSVIPALVVVFFMNKYFTFRDTRRNHGSQLSKFALVYAAAFLWNIGLSLFFLSLGLPSFVAKAAAIACVALWNYCLLHGFVFRKH